MLRNLFARRHSLINESYIQHYAKALFLSLLGMDCGCTTLQETTVTGKDDKKVPGWTHQISSVRNQSLWLSRIMCPLVITHGLLKNPYIYIYCMCMYVYIYTQWFPIKTSIYQGFPPCHVWFSIPAVNTFDFPNWDDDPTTQIFRHGKLGKLVKLLSDKKWGVAKSHEENLKLLWTKPASPSIWRAGFSYLRTVHAPLKDTPTSLICEVITTIVGFISILTAVVAYPSSLVCRKFPGWKPGHDSAPCFQGFTWSTHIHIPGFFLELIQPYG